MRIIHWFADVMTDTFFIAVEHIVCTASDVDDIDEAVFTEGIGEVPKGFLVASGDVVELVVNATYGSAFTLDIVRVCMVRNCWDISLPASRFTCPVTSGCSKVGRKQTRFRG